LTNYVSSLTATTHGVFFCGYASGSSPLQLFFSDGTQEGTRALNPIVGESPSRFTEPAIQFTTGPWCYFSANRNEMWRSDGTEAGTTKLATFPTTAYGALSAWATGTQMIVAVRDFSIDSQDVWSCPLAGGSITHAYPPAGADSWQILRATPLGEQFFFTARNADGSVHLMVSDGTEAGTRELHVPLEDGHELYDIDFTRWHGAVYGFVASWNPATGSPSYTLYQIDGSNDELTFLADFDHQAGFYAESAWREQEDFLYFTAGNSKGQWDLWQTKGTPGTTRIKKNLPLRHYLRAEWDQYVTASESGIYYAALGSPNSSGLSLWLHRGKSGGSLRLTRPEKWTASGVPFFSWYPWPYQSLTYDMVGGRLLSFVSQGTTTADDHELWSMNPDGTRAKSIWKAPGPMNGSEATFGFRGTTPHGSIFYFSDGHGIRQIYRTDGTRRGTRLISDHSTGPGMGIPYGSAQLGDQVFYSLSSTGSPVTSLWKTDGTPEGTMKIVAADGTEPQPVLTGRMPSIQGSLYFLAHGNGGRLQLWRTDGTPAGTMLLKDEWSGGTPTELTAAGGKLLFTVKFYSSILWQSDGTAAGTIPVPGAPAFPVEDGPSS
ncbi:MAG: hypothetical protein EOP87_18065, partial [Verrucomicrobiaceae bacterium]